jgi:hypothetical protein
MTNNRSTTNNTILVAVDVAKAQNDVLVQLLNGERKKMKVANNAKDYQDLYAILNLSSHPV